MLNVIFLLHTFLAAIVAFALLLFTQPFMILVVDGLDYSNWPPIPAEDTIVALAHLAAAGLILIGTVAGLACISGYSVVRWRGIAAMIAVSVVFIVIALFMKASPLDQWVLWINVIFVALYLWIVFFHRETV